MHAFDRRTDGRTDGQTDTFLVAIPRWHSVQRGKTFDYTCTSYTPPTYNNVTNSQGQFVTEH